MQGVWNGHRGVGKNAAWRLHQPLVSRAHDGPAARRRTDRRLIMVELSHPRLARRRAAPAAGLGLLAVMLATGCGSGSSTLDTARIEHAVAASIFAQRGVRTTVSCPSGIPVKTGHSFACTAKLDVGSYPVTVTETNSKGRVRYENKQPLVVLDIVKVQSAIATSILHQRGLKATVTCPQQVLQQAGIAFTCTAVVAGRPTRYPFLVTQTNDTGHVRYEGLKAR